MELPNILIDVNPNTIDQYCEAKGILFAKGEPKKNPNGQIVMDNRGNPVMTNKVSTSKLRNVFSKISSIRTRYRNIKNSNIDSIERDIILLKPILAYAKGRDSNLVNFTIEMKKLIDVTIQSLDKEKEEPKTTKKYKSLDNFFVIVEGFIAYHKFHGGKD